jgi:tripartite-type tricarboxylate transporter receptor subunit TctC
MDYKLVFSEQKVNHILAVLAKQPYEEVAELIADIHKQANEQIKKEVGK